VNHGPSEWQLTCRGHSAGGVSLFHNLQLAFFVSIPGKMARLADLNGLMGLHAETSLIPVLTEPM